MLAFLSNPQQVLFQDITCLIKMYNLFGTYFSFSENKWSQQQKMLTSHLGWVSGGSCWADKSHFQENGTWASYKTSVVPDMVTIQVCLLSVFTSMPCI